MPKRSLSYDTKDENVKALRRHEPVVLPAADGGPNPNVSMASLPGCLDEPIVLGSPSLSSETSQSLEASDDQSSNLPQDISDAESEYIDRDDDDEEDEDRDDFSLNERATIKIQPTLQQDEEEPPHYSGIFVPGVEDMDGDFWNALREYMVHVDVYPSMTKHGNSLKYLCKRMFNVPQSQRIRITRAVQEKIAKAAVDWRAVLSRAVKAVMKSYTYHPTTLPESCKNNRKRQFKYMTDAMRFARKDYLSSGAILQSGALGDVIAKVFYDARKGVGLTLDDDDSDGKVPRSVIALTFVFMYVHMDLLCTKKEDQPSPSGPGVGASRASLYHSALKGVFENGETVDWDQVQRVQTRHVHEKLQDRQVARHFSSGPLSKNYQPKYRDGEYLSDSHDN